jgi:hypothetical protein
VAALLHVLALTPTRYERQTFYTYRAPVLAPTTVEAGDVVELYLVRDGDAPGGTPALRGILVLSSEHGGRGPFHGTWRGQIPDVLGLVLTPKQAHELDLLLQANAGWSLLWRVTDRARSRPRRYY